MIEKRSICVTWDDNQEEECRNSCLNIGKLQSLRISQCIRIREKKLWLDINSLICRKWPQLNQKVFFSVSKVTWEDMDIEVTHLVAPQIKQFKLQIFHKISIFLATKMEKLDKWLKLLKC